MPKLSGKGILGRRDASAEEIRLALGEAIYLALREHKRQGVPAVTMRDGQIVIVPPDEIVIPEEYLVDEEPDTKPAD
jgi:hypothetical protein